MKMRGSSDISYLGQMCIRDSHWIGTEPFMDEFKTIGLDAVVGSVGNGATLRLISDIEGVKYTEGRLLDVYKRQESRKAILI